MSDREALLATIRARPEEDTPRLVFADWLDEHGESERAALIRYSCSPKFANRRSAEFRRAQRIAKRDFPSDTFRIYFAPRDCDCFEHKGAATVMEALLQLPPDSCMARILFDRGFVVAAVCSARQWLTHADAILAEHPVRRVRLTTWPVLCCDRDHEPGLLLTIFSGESRRSFRLPEPFDFGTPPTNLLERFWDGIEFELPPAPAYQFSGVIQNWTVSTTPVTGGSILTGTNAGGGK